jgi:6-phosphogluconate dehydrogenase
MTKADIGLIGLAVMGQNLVLNMSDHGFAVAVYNRTASVTDEFLAGSAKGRTIYGAHTLEELAGLLKRPRRVMLMVKAGQPVDDFIEKLLGVLEPGDIIMDGGNSNYEDSIRRTAYVESKGLLYIGTGVSGGEEGARHGPSIMPGGSPAAWPAVKPILQAIAAKVPEGDPNGVPCCDWVGENGAGHFVKMVHNGIEYGDMQIISEAYHLMKEGLEMSNDEMCGVLDRWNQGKLESYLIEISRDILGFKDADNTSTIDIILDRAGQKGTGKWTVISSLDQGIPLTLIAEAVFARALSALKDERVAASHVLDGPQPGAGAIADRAAFIADRLCREDRVLHPGLHADARRGRGVQVEPELRRHRADVARRLHHPLGLPGQDQGGVRRRPEPHQPAGDALLPGSGDRCAGRMAPCGRQGDRAGHPRADHVERAGLL